MTAPDNSGCSGCKETATARPTAAAPTLEISPNLWAGVGLVRGGAGTALVGSADTVAARMKEYAEVGIETFILSGYPHLEEAYRVAELLFPALAALPRRPPTTARRPRPTHAGEVMANELVPAARTESARAVTPLPNRVRLPLRRRLPRR